MIELPPGSTSIDVKIYKVSEVPSTRPGAKSSYRLRWMVAGVRPPHSKTYRSKGQANARWSKLTAAVSEGIAFHITSGLPVTEHIALMEAEAAKARQENATSWLDHASEFAAMKWTASAPGTRRNLSWALAVLTPAMYATKTGRPDTANLREALYGWAYSPGLRYRPGVDGERVENEPPEHLRAAFAWLGENTISVEEIDAAVVRVAAELAATKYNGAPAAAATTMFRRGVLSSVLDYAVEKKLLEGNPLREIKLPRPRATKQIDRRRVANHAQARALLGAVGTVEDGRYRRLVVFFACTYYSALRPEEVNALTEPDITLPDEVDEDGWGEFLLTEADPEVGLQWTNSGKRETRGLKHRAPEDTRPVPIPPHLVRIIRQHVAEFGWAPEGHLVRGVRSGGPVPAKSYGGAFQLAREAAFTPEQRRSPLARTPYDLRHACLSGWLNAGVPATQVAEWAGHSLQMLLTTYAKCVDGQEHVSRKRIAEALSDGLPDVPEVDEADDDSE